MVLVSLQSLKRPRKLKQKVLLVVRAKVSSSSYKLDSEKSIKKNKEAKINK